MKSRSEGCCTSEMLRAPRLNVSWERIVGPDFSEVSRPNVLVPCHLSISEDRVIVSAFVIAASRVPEGMTDIPLAVNLSTPVLH